VGECKATTSINWWKTKISGVVGIIGAMIYGIICGIIGAMIYGLCPLTLAYK